METKNRESAEQQRTGPIDRKKSKTLALIDKTISEMQQPELAKIAFSIKYWHDDSCSEDELYITGPPSGSNPKGSLVLEETKHSERSRIWRKKIRHKLSQTPRNDLLSVIMDEADRMSNPDLQHLSRSLSALQQRKG